MSHSICQATFFGDLRGRRPTMPEQDFAAGKKYNDRTEVEDREQELRLVCKLCVVGLPLTA